MKIFLIFASIFLCMNANSHCPLKIPNEKMCGMREENLLYFWSDKFEHNGPYQDFKLGKILNIFENNQLVTFKKVANGILKINTSLKSSKIEIQYQVDNPTKTIKRFQL